MRILVVGDTHGRISPLINKIRELEFDYMFFTGDFIADASKIVRRKPIKYKGVRGNCDPRTGHEEQIIEMDGKRFYLIHGHQLSAKKGHDLIWQRGKEIGADAVIFGHTHKACSEKIGGIWLINPGSPSYPRSGAATYAVINISEGQIHPYIVEL